MRLMMAMLDCTNIKPLFSFREELKVQLDRAELVYLIGEEEPKKD